MTKEICKPFRGTRAECLVLLLLVPLATFGFAACGDDGEGPSDGSAGSEATASASDGATEAAGDAFGLRGDTLVVELSDFDIEIPDTIPAGELYVIARNVGVEDHNLEIKRGDELFWAFDRDIGPQQTQEAVLDLEPGRYSVLCTVSGHDGRGMVTRLTVVDRPET